MNVYALHEIIEAGHVRRCHTTPSDVTQTVGHHSWGVVVILLYIFPNASRAAILRALYHDVAERTTGDVPATAKWLSRDLSAALEALEIKIEDRLDIYIDCSPDEREAVKLADLLELLIFSRHRIHSGDRYFEGYEQRLIQYINERCDLKKFPNAAEILYHPFTPA